MCDLAYLSVQIHQIKGENTDGHVNVFQFDILTRSVRQFLKGFNRPSVVIDGDDLGVEDEGFTILGGL